MSTTIAEITSRRVGRASESFPDRVAGEVADPAVLLLEEPDRREVGLEPMSNQCRVPAGHRQQVAAFAHHRKYFAARDAGRSRLVPATKKRTSSSAWRCSARNFDRAAAASARHSGSSWSGRRRGHIDVPVAAVGVDRGDLLGVFGQDPLGGLARVEAGPTGSDRKRFRAGRIRRRSAPHRRCATAPVGVGVGHHLQQCHSIPFSRRPVNVTSSHIASRHSTRSRACARSAPHAVIPWPAMNSTGGACGCSGRCARCRRRCALRRQ